MTKVIEFGFCHCGCGQKTGIMEANNPARGWIKGRPKFFIHKHHVRLPHGKGRNVGASNPSWKGGPGYAPSTTRVYRLWKSMIGRCTNSNAPEFAYYGGRGITVCSRWRTFAHFIADMGPKPSDTHTLERIDNDGNYEPANCRWATRAEQMRNTKATVHISFDGRTQCLADWAAEVGMTRETLSSRLRLGWSVEAALTTTPRRRSARQ